MTVRSRRSSSDIMPAMHNSKMQTAVAKCAATLRRHALLLPVALLAACAVPPGPSDGRAPGGQAPQATPTQSAPVSSTDQAVLRKMIEMQDRLYKIAAPLLTSNAPLCKGNARSLLGFTAKNAYSYSAQYTNAARSLGFDDRLQVTGVLPNSGAARSDVRRGDILQSIGDKPMPQGDNAEQQAAALLTPMVAKRTPLKLGLLRGATPMTVNVPLTLACSFSIELGNADIVNAYSDGRRVLITRGMMNFVHTDEELAYLVAKEIAHNALGQPGRQKMVATIGGVIDNLTRTQPDPSTLAGTAGILPYNQDMDAAADTLALYMLVRAGYSIDNAPRFWRRLAEAYPASVPNGYTAIHPSTMYRLAMIGKVTQIIAAKQAAGKPLMP
ncbi:MAG: peptidase [Herbaspirillum sp.]|nr:peptidase [Herbaspirillum sp.]